MAKFIDMTGQRFGRFLLLWRGENQGGYSTWYCKCDCGNFKFVRAHDLRSGKTVSCGCLNKERVSSTHTIDLHNQRFERLYVLRRAGSKNNKAMWECICDCGTIRAYCGVSLIRGLSKSCGCLRKENSGPNHYKWKGGVTELRHAIRTSAMYLSWRKSCFERDRYTCQMCGKVGGKLNVDHIKPFSQIMDSHKILTLKEARKCKELWDTNNGRTLCVPCHRTTDTYAGRTKPTGEDSTKSLKRQDTSNQVEKLA